MGTGGLEHLLCGAVARTCDNADHGDAKAGVHREEATGLHRLHEAIRKALELRVARTDVRG